MLWFPQVLNAKRTLKSKKDAYFVDATENIATAIENIVTCLHAICLMSQDEAKCDSYGRQINTKYENTITWDR